MTPERAAWLRARRPELAIVAVGLALRVALFFTFPVERGFDYYQHWPYIQWFAHRFDLPPLDFTVETFHPPLYYFLGGLLVRLHATPQGLSLLSIACGCARLLLFWVGVERWLPGRTFARRVALVVCAFLPTSLHLDGMLMAEALNNLLALGALLTVAEAFAVGEGPGRARWRWALLSGALVGLELLTKVSGLLLLLSAGAIATVELVRVPGARLRRFAPFVVAALVAVTLSGWFYARNVSLTGHPFLTSFDAKEKGVAAASNKLPYWKRRPLDFYFGWQSVVFRYPYARRASDIPYNFPSTLVASTFVDYYNFGFSPAPAPGQPQHPVNYSVLRDSTLWPSRLSVLGGTVVAATTVLAWLYIVPLVWRRRDLAGLWFCLVPLVALAGQLDFAVRYPIDRYGVIKGSYLQFAAPPLYALFGLAVAALARRSRPLALLPLTGLALVVFYTLWCRLLTFLL